MNSIDCIELSNGYDISLINGSFSHCCKFQNIQLQPSEIKELGGKVFDLNSETVKARADLQQGIQTPRCQDCWDLENKNQLSWRLLRTKKDNTDRNKVTVGIQLSSLCNQSCFYCTPLLSSTIASKYNNWVDRSGNLYPIVKNNELENNLKFDHIVEFVKSIPKNINSLVISVTGGEPFMLENFEKSVVDLIKMFLDASPDNTANLVISTNTNVKTEKLLKFYENIKRIDKSKLTTTISCSIENLEDRAEYVRGGLLWNNFLENFKIHEQYADRILIRMTFNAFTVVKILDFVKFFANKKVSFCYNYTQQKFFRIEILDNRFHKELIDLEDYIIDKQIGYKFENEFYKDLAPLLINDKLNANKFRSAITHLDNIKKTNWRNIFPEYIEWFDQQ